MPTYLTYIYIFFQFELRSNPELDPIFFPAGPDPDPRKKVWLLNPGIMAGYPVFSYILLHMNPSKYIKFL